MLDLRFHTPDTWLEPVFEDFDAFLIDHAACERKAAATGMSLVVKYPDRTAIIEPLIAFAREELEHFHQVYQVMAARGLLLGSDYKDEYVNGLRSKLRDGTHVRLLDRLLAAGIVEARGCERLRMVAQRLEAQRSELASLYLDLTRAESRHHALFFRLAREYFSAAEVEARADELLDYEAELVRRLPHRAAVH
jgi:tRNA-(ms[2]io[6]A)-hydroxylase